MSQKSKIEWTDASWNSVRGCTKCSEGCAHCYAETFAERFRGVPGHPYEQGFDLRLVPDKIREPFLWKEPLMVFVNSMSDFFHKDVPDYPWRRQTGIPIKFLTELLKTKLRAFAELSHVWWGVSVENRKHGLPRIDQLRQAPAAGVCAMNTEEQRAEKELTRLRVTWRRITSRQVWVHD